MSFRKLLFLAAAVALAATAKADRVYPVTGVVRAPLSEGRVVVAHDAIDGLMPAMTMGFGVTSGATATANRLQPGDRIAFSLHVDETRYVADDIRIVGHSGPTRASTTTRVNRVRAGDAVPEFALVDERNRPLTMADLRGHLTVLTFVFTRCPVPEFCPLVSLRFGELQRSIVAEPGLAGRVRLLSVTLDPEHDRPDVLTEYAHGIGADPAVWSFATGESAQIDAVVSAFSVYRERNGVTLDHTLCTALVGADGRIVELWRGNGWTTADVLATIRAQPDGASR